MKIRMPHPQTRPLCVLLLALGLVAPLCGCGTASWHRAQVQDDSTDRVTVGRVQREIRVGMSGAEVAQVLGSPNIVTTDEQRRETWVYDKIATDQVYSTSQGGLSALILGHGSDVAGGGGTGFSGGAGAASTTQRTLTVVIKFDDQGQVRDFSYHSTRF